MLIESCRGEGLSSKRGTSTTGDIGRQLTDEIAQSKRCQLLKQEAVARPVAFEYLMGKQLQRQVKWKMSMQLEGVPLFRRMVQMSSSFSDRREKGLIPRVKYDLPLRLSSVPNN